jgi:Lon-like ATP-dependent protease
MNVFGSLLGAATRRAASAGALRGAYPIPRRTDWALRSSWLARSPAYSTIVGVDPLFNPPIARLTNEHDIRLGEADDPADTSSSSTPPSNNSSSGDNDGGSDSSDPPSSSAPPPDSPSSPKTTSIQRPSVPDVYPQLLALPITRRPLFPGFYKAVVIRDPAVVAAIKEMVDRGQPYIGAFLLKDDQSDADVITDIDSVHPVGVFAQVTSIFNANTGTGAATGAGKSGDPNSQEGLTAVLYPHRRIRITDLIRAGGQQPAMVNVESAEVTTEDGQVPTPPPSPEPESEGAQVDIAKVPGE